MPHWKIPSLLEVLTATGCRIGVIVSPEEAHHSFYGELSDTNITRIEGSVAEVARELKAYTHCVSTDSGWLHVAHLYGLPTLGLFGFENDDVWSPPESLALRSEHCLPASARYSSECEALQPLGTLRIEAFREAVEKLLGKTT
jgi:ADP-heptose:LPS heptosyltransferase